MIDRSLAQREPAPTAEQAMLGRIEEEIDRLRECRPALDGVIDRAAGIIVTHLACPRQRVILVRIGLGGRPKFVFRSLNERGARYIINPVVWSCTCPAYHRTEGCRPCKHVLAAFILFRVGRPAPEVKACNGCGEVLPSRELREIQHEDDNEQWLPGDVLCEDCVPGHWA